MRFRFVVIPFLFALCRFGMVFSQTPELSPLSKISVLTSGSGGVLYSAFGHSAFRVQEPSLGIDVVYNYGVFDTSGENFYWKFSQGRMDYKLVRERFDLYLKAYVLENRWVKEQVLNLSIDERNELFKFLEHNNLPENKVYSYDYFTNNCATKIWDVLETVFGKKLSFKEDYIEERYSFRELIHHNIDVNSWGAFGIDVALGSVIDRKATPKEHMYLPIYILRQLNSAQLGGGPLATPEVTLYESKPDDTRTNFFTTPLFFFLVIALVIITITYFDFKKGRCTRGVDFTILLLTGLAGSVLTFLWFFTDHIWTVKNYNVLWAFPLNLIVAFLVLRRPISSLTGNYLIVLIVLMVLMTAFWLFGVQDFSYVLIPLFISLMIRYYYVWHFSRNSKSAVL